MNTPENATEKIVLKPCPFCGEKEKALRAIRVWVGVIADHLDIDPDTTVITVNTVGPDGKRELAKRSLTEIFDQVDTALGGSQ